jgi:hypothetical protein
MRKNDCTILIISPLSIRQSIRATEKLLYQYALYLKSKSFKVKLLTPVYIIGQNPDEQFNPAHKIKEEKIIGFKIHVFFDFYFYINIKMEKNKKYILYFPFGIYNNLLNILFKFNKNIYIIGSHGLLLDKNGNAFSYHPYIEKMVIFLTKIILRLRPNLRKTIYFHILNPYQKRYLNKLGIDDDHIFFVPNFIDFSEFYYKNRAGRLKLLHIGGVDKNIALVILLIKKLISKGLIHKFEFHFIGKNQPPEIYELANEYPNNIFVYGLVSEDKKKVILSDSDVLLIPAIESFPVSALEGIASGLIILGMPNLPLYYFKQLGLEVEIADFESDKIISILEKLYTLKRAGKLNLELKRKIRHRGKLKFDKNKVLPQIAKMFNQVEKVTSPV